MAYTNNSPFDRTARFLRFENKKPKLLVISDWTTAKYGEILFKCYVTQEDGEEADKIWSVFDFDLAEKMKKVVRGKKTHQKIKLKVIMSEIDEFDKEYEIKVEK